MKHLNQLNIVTFRQQRNLPKILMHLLHLLYPRVCHLYPFGFGAGVPVLSLAWEAMVC